MTSPTRFFLRLGACALVTASGLFGRHRGDNPTERARSSPVFTVYVENDIFSGTDEHYTSGVKFSWLSVDLVDWGQSGWRQTFIELLPFVNRRAGQKAIGFALG